VLRHELVELFLVLGVAQPIEEILEFGLLLFETLQGLDAVFVESAVAARGRTETAEAEAAARSTSLKRRRRYRDCGGQDDSWIVMATFDHEEAEECRARIVEEMRLLCDIEQAMKRIGPTPGRLESGLRYSRRPG
jgi:hypothetical protein